MAIILPGMIRAYGRSRLVPRFKWRFILARFF